MGRTPRHKRHKRHKRHRPVTCDDAFAICAGQSLALDRVVFVLVRASFPCAGQTSHVPGG
jgi:hypothetical protein